MAKKKIWDPEEVAVDEAYESIPPALVRSRLAYTPTEQDQEVYRTWARYLNISKTAQVCGLSRESVSKRLALVRAWLQDQFIDDAADVRAQHLALLQQHYSELRELWDVARLINPACGRKSAGKKGTTSHGKVEKLDRPIQIVKEMRETLKTIAAYIGVLRVTEDGAGDDSGDRVAGIPRQTYIQNQIIQLQVQLEREQEMDSARAGRVISQDGSGG